MNLKAIRQAHGERNILVTDKTRLTEHYDLENVAPTGLKLCKSTFSCVASTAHPQFNASS